MRRIAIILGVVLVVLAIATLAVHILFDANRLRPILESKLSAALSRDVRIGSLELSILSGGVTARDVAISDDAAFSGEPFIHTGSLHVSVELKPLLFDHQLNITGITVDQPDVRLVQTLAGKWNYSTLGLAAAAGATPARATPPPPPATAAHMQIGSFRVTGGRISLLIPGGQAAPLVFDQVNVEMKNVSTTGAVPFTLSASLKGGATIQSSGTAGPLSSSDSAATPIEAVVHAAQVDLLKSGLVDDATEITGLATLDANFSGKGDETIFKGKLKLEQLKLVKAGKPAKKPVEITFSLAHQRKTQSGELTECAIRFGSAVADLTGHYDLSGKTPVIHMKLAGPKLDVTELAAMLPAMDVVLPAGASIERGTASVRLAFDGPVDKLLTVGTLGVTNTQLSNYDLATKLRVLSALSGIRVGPHTEIQTLSTNIRVSRAGTQLDGIRLVVPSIGELTGAGFVSPAHALDFKMRVTVTQIAGLVPNAGGLGAIPFTITGTSDNPAFRPDMKTFATDKLHDLTTGKTTPKGLLDGLFGRKPKQ